MAERYIADSFQGTTHKENQDRFLVIEEENYDIFCVFDGVSRSAHPAEGATLAVDFITKNHTKYFNNNSFDLKALMWNVNEEILKSNWDDALTTYCCLCILNSDRNRVMFSSLGDSRIYIIDKEKTIPVTSDDSLFPGSNVLTKCLGISTLIFEDFTMESMNLNDQDILLCSDGFYGLMEMQMKMYVDLFNSNNTSQIKDLIKQKIEGNNFDDASYVFIACNA